MVESTVKDLVAVLAQGREADFAAQWAGEAAAALGLDGLAASLLVGEPELIWFSEEVSARLEDLQFTLGEGPSLEAARAGAICLVADVRSAPAARWAGFLPAVTQLGVRAVFAFPLRLGSLKVGALTGHRHRPGMMSGESIEHALTLCDALTDFLLRKRLPSPSPGDAAHTPPGTAGLVHLHRAEVHQATGMIAVQLGIPLPAALSRLRAEAFATGRGITEVAASVLRGGLRLTANNDPTDSA
ncbi:ANTAR domain-containing protein [Streptomyces ochraceiscleroticus]|uniref:ANTAR domain-containing protein n=1 Tax=Streptomyces ochraceiscleroticus TaxID=47761 RepID=A0ABW1MJ47_9ACTN|nr:ANTAR domain-containing protein [Streptomyces ochraceiscleroticus]